MAFRVYLSHSVAPHELGAIYGMAQLAEGRGLQPIVPDRRWQRVAPPPRIAQLLEGLDAFVIVATRLGEEMEWVKAELSTALRLGLKPENVVSVVDEGIDVPWASGSVITIDRSDFQTTMEQVVGTLARLQLDRNQRNLLGALIVGGLVALLLASKE